MVKWWIALKRMFNTKPRSARESYAIGYDAGFGGFRPLPNVWYTADYWVGYWMGCEDRASDHDGQG